MGDGPFQHPGGSPVPSARRVLARHDPTFAVEESEDGPVCVVAVHGELDLSTAPQLRERLHAALAEGHSDLVVDLSEMSFMDSSAISVLVEGMKRAQRQDGRLVLRSPTPSTRRVLEIAGLLAIFGLVDDASPAT